MRTRPVRTLLLTMSAIWTAMAIYNGLTGIDYDCYAYTIAAIITLAGVFAGDYLQAEHDRDIADTRTSVWERRDRQDGLSW